MPSKPPETWQNLKQQADHARWLASNVSGEEAADRLREYAEELERRAEFMGEEK